jgi:hypothetical protein
MARRTKSIVGCAHGGLFVLTAIVMLCPVLIATSWGKEQNSLQQLPAAMRGPKGGLAPLPSLPQQLYSGTPDLDSKDGDASYTAYQRGYYLRAFALALKNAEAGDAVAMTMIGHLYEIGAGVARDPKRAASWYGLASARGDREAMALLGLMKLFGSGIPREPREALALLEEASAKNQPAALYQLAVLYLEGELVKRDSTKAAGLLARSATLGKANAD